MVEYVIRMDEADKKIMDEVFSMLRIDFEAGVNFYIRSVADGEKIPFELSLPNRTDHQ
ncbi:MAG: hypothetical protein LBS19_02860 [Clostridiales bacterium]|jgi:antitoxin component of RelBE/YafQ-DinJ toxin-antitoxin module|nr:hypothetical protein [Clostridiales bacterium]